MNLRRDVPRLLLRLLRRFGPLALVGLLTYAACLTLFYKRLIFPAPRTARLEVPPSAKLMVVRAADGVAVSAVDFPAPDATSRRTVVYFHGNAETAESNYVRVGPFTERGIRFVIVEYRGYGSSPDVDVTEDGFYADAAAVLDALAAEGTGPSDVVLWGTSLGTGVAAEMAKRGRGRALVLVTPYTSLPDAAAAHAPYLPTGLIVREKFDTLSKARDIRVPTLVVHGTLDGVVPYAMGERVAKALPDARIVTIEGGDHNDAFRREPRLLGWVLAHVLR